MARASPLLALGRRMLHLTTLGATDLRRPDGTSVQAVLAGPKRFALLAYLASARPHGFHRRDVLLALLWPEVDQDRGRATLRTTLYHLRQAIGASAVLTRGDEEIGIDRTALTCDAVEFERALDAGRTAEALAFYKGDFLPGFYVPGAADWERWLETERARLRARAASAAWSLAEDAATAANAEDANRWARRAFEIQPDDEGALRRLVTILDQIGDRSGAIAAYDAFARELQEEYDSDPAPETQKLIQSVRGRVELLAEPQLRARTTKMPVNVSVEKPSPRSGSRRFAFAGAVAAAVLSLTLAVFGLLRSSDPDKTVLAVGDVEIIGAADSLSGFPILLATNLARVQGLSVISEGRLREVSAALPRDAQGDASLTRAAAAAGATEIVEGALSQRARGGYRLDLRRVDVKSGETRGAFSIESPEIFDLVDLATEWVAEEHGVREVGSRYAASMSSLVAYQLYEQGLGAFYKGDRTSAERFFRTALSQDSGFAMAAYYLSRVARFDESARWLELAERGSRTAVDRERLFIRTAWLHYMQDPRGLAVAETMAVRYPAEPEGHLMYGRSLIINGSFAAAIPHLKRVIEIDTLSKRAGSPRCWACEARDRLADAYMALDSFAALERMAVLELRNDPNSPSAWARLGSAHLANERFDKTLDAGRRSAELRGETDIDFYNADALTRAGEFDRLHRMWQRKLVTGDRDARMNAYAGQAMTYRTQGRFREAIAAATNFRELASEPPARPEAAMHEANLLAAALMDAQRFAQAAALYDSIAAFRATPVESRHGRHVAWTLSHAAGAYAALGDTARLRVLEDTIRNAGARSAYMRDRLLHHYVRGLRHMVTGHYAEAAAAFRRSLYSTVSGYSRINLQLGRTYLAMNRPREAIAILEAGLRGPVGATGTYATRTELQELLALAYERAGDRNRAAAQYRRVLHAWSRADEQLRARRAAASRRLAALD